MIRAFDVSLIEAPPMPVAIVTTQPGYPPMFRLRAR